MTYKRIKEVLEKEFPNDQAVKGYSEGLIDGFGCFGYEEEYKNITKDGLIKDFNLYKSIVEKEV